MHITNVLPTLLSLVALLFSGYSLYETVLRAPQLSIFVAPRIDYVDPDRPEAVREVFILPMTLANDGARPATAIAINLQVTNPRTKQSKTFYAARLGSWGEMPLRPFTPVVLGGRATYSHPVQFEPRAGESVMRILDQDAGTYEFKLTVDTAGAGQAGAMDAASIAPLTFTMETGDLDYRYFNGTGTMLMWAPAYRPPAPAPK